MNAVGEGPLYTMWCKVSDDICRFKTRIDAMDEDSVSEADLAKYDEIRENIISQSEHFLAMLLDHYEGEA